MIPESNLYNPLLEGNMHIKKNTGNINLKSKFLGNIMYAFSAQLISLFVSLLLSLIVPKFLGVTEFAYWQLFIFYSNYVNIAQLGIVDGIYLKLGGKNYEDLDYSVLKAEYKVFALFQFAVGIIIASMGFIFSVDRNKVIVFIGIALYMIIYNLSRYLGFIFQAVNNTKWYSIASMIDRITILILGTLAIVTKNIYWQLFIMIYISGVLVSLAYSWWKGKEILSVKSKCTLSQTFKELKDNGTIGISLMISNLASTLILGIGRQSIEWHWGLDMFGRVSFALSMTNFFLLFINQVSLVMFPALRKVDANHSLDIYKKVDYAFSVISPIVYIVYIPVAFLLKKWLPQYESSLTYLMIFMPVCVFDGKMQMLYNTYMKVYRKEKVLLMINIVSVILSLINAMISILIFNNFDMLLIGLVIVVVIRSLISSVYLGKFLNNSLPYTFLFDLLFAILFICVCLLTTQILAETVVVIAFTIFILTQYKKMKNLFKKT